MALRWAQHLHVQVRELEERRMLLNRPWEEDFLHWSHNGKNWHLHGHVVPPAKRRYRSTTRSGWCPAQDNDR